jgi:hypothetical protein
MPWLTFGVPIRKTCLHQEQMIVGSAPGPSLELDLITI